MCVCVCVCVCVSVCVVCVPASLAPRRCKGSMCRWYSSSHHCSRTHSSSLAVGSAHRCSPPGTGSCTQAHPQPRALSHAPEKERKRVSEPARDNDTERPREPRAWQMPPLLQGASLHADSCSQCFPTQSLGQEHWHSMTRPKRFSPCITPQLA